MELSNFINILVIIPCAAFVHTLVFCTLPEQHSSVCFIHLVVSVRKINS